MNIIQWLKNINIYKFSSHISYNDVFIILEHVFKKNMFWILSNIFFEIDSYKLNMLNIFFIKRLRGEPVFYIINKGFFKYISYHIYSDIFIPRYDTEIMVDYAINLIKINNFSKILDLGTGSGVIALSIAKSCINSFVIGIDYNILSINLAKYNSRKLKIDNVLFFKSNWFSNLSNKKEYFNIIISNPPYINKNNICFNILNDLRFESYFSLFSKFHGILDILFIINESYFHLKNKGWLIIEHSHESKDIVRYLFSKKFFNIFSYKDYNNLYRFTIGQKNIF